VRVVIIFCITSLLAFPLGAQDTGKDTPDSSTSTAVAPYRNPHRALVLGSLIPGAGHIYAGEYLRGFLTYEATVGAIGAGTLVFLVDKCTFTFLSTTTCKPGAQWPHQVLGIAVVGLGVWEWISSARDAPRAAERANARHDARSSAVTPFVAPFSGPGNASQIGVSVHW
jgi:TM2 domain-containing membrane protein YozV